ncbi:MAG: extracellular solute-binding protein [Paenibacillaceae bacterium]|nr:extracellular solute-binding protein [Paenibacillaceae bacterium]
MKQKRWFAGALALAVTAALAAGCSGAKDDNKGTAGSSPSGTAQGTASAAKAPVTYSIGTDQNKLTWDTPITKKITEKTGVTLKYDVIVGDMFQKWDIWQASGDYPDIIRLDALHMQKYIEAGAVIPLEKLIDQYGPNIKAKFGTYYDSLKNKDGHIYSLYSVNLAKEAPANRMAPFIVQQAVLEDAGYPQIKTLAQLKDVIKAYAAKNPKIDGKDTIGFAAGMESFMVNIMFNNPSISASGLPDHGNFFLDGSLVKWNPVSDRSKEYYKFLNSLVRDNLFDIEAFSMNDAAFKTKLAQGRVLAAYAPNWLSDQPDATLRADGKEKRMYAHLPILMDDKTTDKSVAVTPTSPGTHQWGITKDAKNPERIIQFIDFLFSDEGQVLTQWGIEGTHYKVVNGKRQVLDEWLDRKAKDPDALYKDGFNSEGTPTMWFGIGDGAKLADGDYATPMTKELVRKQYTENTKNVLAKYKAETWADLLPPAVQLKGYVWQLQPPEDTRAIGVKLEEVWRKSLPKIVLAKTDDEFAKNWEQFVADANAAGAAKYNDSFTKIWADFNAN